MDVFFIACWTLVAIIAIFAIIGIIEVWNQKKTQNL